MKRNKFQYPYGRRWSYQCRSGAGSGDMDGCTCGRNPSDTKTWETGGDQSYWYNALCIMQKFSEVLKKNEEQKYGELAQKVKESFAREFWMEEKHCLKDVISETKADTQIRCNQYGQCLCRLQCWTKRKKDRL